MNLQLLVDHVNVGQQYNLYQSTRSVQAREPGVKLRLCQNSTKWKKRTARANHGRLDQFRGLETRRLRSPRSQMSQWRSPKLGHLSRTTNGEKCSTQLARVSGNF